MMNNSSCFNTTLRAIICCFIRNYFISKTYGKLALVPTCNEWKSHTDMTIKREIYGHGDAHTINIFTQWDERQTNENSFFPILIWKTQPCSYFDGLMETINIC